MKKHLSEEQERGFCERFDRGGRTDGSGEEARVFHAYGRVQSGIRSLRVPKIDSATLSRRLAREMGHRGGWRDRSRRMLMPVLATACVVCLLAGLARLVPLLRTPQPPPLASVKFVDALSSLGREAPRFWEHRLERGSAVTVPGRVTAELCLSDGSVVSCSPETQIAVRVGADRQISLNSGSITVQAAQIPGSTMIVETPLGNVQVVGTVFWIEVVR